MIRGGIGAIAAVVGTVLIFSREIIWGAIANYAKENGTLLISFATFFGPVLGASIAAYAALVILPGKLKGQRQIEWEKQKRADFGNFLALVEAVLAYELPKLTNESAEIISLSRGLGVLTVVAETEEVLKAAKELVRLINSSIQDGRSNPDGHSRKERSNLIIPNLLGAFDDAVATMTHGDSGSYKRHKIISKREELITKMRKELMDGFK